MSSPILDAQKQHYAGVRARLMSSAPAPQSQTTIRRTIYLPIRPTMDLASLPRAVDRDPPMAPVRVLPPKARPRDFIHLLRVNDRGRVPESMWRPVLCEVMYAHNVNERDMVADIRPMNVVLARQEYFYRLREEFSMSFTEIGATIGRDQSTVRHGYLKHKAKLEAAALEAMGV